MIANRWARVPPFERGLTLGDFLVPIRVGERAASWQRHLLMMLIGALLIVLGARLSFYLPGNPFVPVTFESFSVLFAGALLGFRRGLGAVGIYLLLGIIGLPVFPLDATTGQYGSGLDTIVSLNPPGPQFTLGPTGGYLIGFLLAAGIVGRLAELGWDRKIGGALGAMVIGNVAIYLVAVPWLMAATQQNLNWALTYGVYPFIPFDVVKIAVAAVLLPVGWWIVHRRSSER